MITIEDIWDKVYDLQERISDLKANNEALKIKLLDRESQIHILENKLRNYDASPFKIWFNRLFGYVEPRDG
jgi:hypothetical protein